MPACNSDPNNCVAVAARLECLRIIGAGHDILTRYIANLSSFNVERKYSITTKWPRNSNGDVLTKHVHGRRNRGGGGGQGGNCPPPQYFANQKN